MKRLFNLLLMLSITTVALSQQKPPYDQTHTPQVLSNWGVWNRYFLGLPHGATPYFPSWVPDSLKNGAPFVNTTDGLLYFYNAKTGNWENGWAIANSRIDSLSNGTKSFTGATFSGDVHLGALASILGYTTDGSTYLWDITNTGHLDIQGISIHGDGQDFYDDAAGLHYHLFYKPSQGYDGGLWEAPNAYSDAKKLATVDDVAAATSSKLDSAKAFQAINRKADSARAYAAINARQSQIIASVNDYGAKGDVKTTTGSIASGSSVALISGLTSADIGKRLTINGAGSPLLILNSTGNRDTIPVAISGTITAVLGNNVTLSATASTSVLNAAISYGTDNASAIQTAINSISSSGGGTLFVPNGKYGIASGLNIAKNVNFEGADKYNSILYALDNNFVMINRDTTLNTILSGSLSVKNMRFHAYGDRINYQNLPTSPMHILRLSAYQYVDIDNCFFEYSREMSINTNGGFVRITNCNIENGLRDGINCSEALGVTVLNNRIVNCDDDAISVDATRTLNNVISATTPTGSYTDFSIISGNIIHNSQGIFSGGFNNAIITNNHGSLIKNRGIALQFSSASTYMTGKNALIANNDFADVYKLIGTEINYGPANSYPSVVTNTRYSASGSAYGISVSLAPLQVGTTSPVPNVAPGLFDQVLKQFVDPATYWNYVGTARPIGPSNGIIVDNNVLKQTVTGIDSISQMYNEGVMMRKGLSNYPYQGTIALGNGGAQQDGYYRMYGISIDGPVDGLVIGENTIYGYQRGIYFSSPTYLQRAKVGNNTIQRCLSPIYFNSSGSAYSADVDVSNNTIDADPQLESTSRAFTASFSGFTDASITANTNLLNTAGAWSFTSSDLGKWITITGAGFTGASSAGTITTNNLYAQIIAINSTTQAVLSKKAYKTVTGATVTGGLLTGGWKATTDVYYQGITASYIQGIKVKSNSFKNSETAVSTNSSTVAYINDNYYYCDPLNSYGIAKLQELTNNRVIWQDSGPQSATFGNLLGTGVYDASAMPTTGYYVKGDIVKNNAPVIVNGQILYGWLRLTTGNGQTIYVDWSPIYVMTNNGSAAAYRMGDGGLITASYATAPTRTSVADANYTAQQTDYLVSYSSLTAARTVTLVAITGATAALPKFVVVKDESGAAGTYNITVTAPSGKTIDGASSKTVNTNYGELKVYYNGTNFFTTY